MRRRRRALRFSKMLTRNRSIGSGVLALALLCPSSSDAQEDLTPTETIQLLEAVEGLGDSVHEKRVGIHSISIAAFREGAVSSTAAYDFYLKCYKLVNFEAKEARESEWRDWKADNAKRLREKSHAESRRLQLAFLVLTLRAAQIQEPEDRYELGDDLLALADACIEHYGEADRYRRVLHEGAVGSIYGEAYKLGSTLRGFGDWPSAPLDLDGIYEQVVMPPYRSFETAGELAGIWDRRMNQEVRLVAALDEPDREAKFTEIDLPRLKWQKQLDLLKAGQRRQALKAMVGLIEKNLGHPNIDGWITQLKGYLSGDIELPSFDDEE